MPKFFIQGYLSIDPPSHPDDVMDGLNRHGAGLTSSSADRGGSHFRVGETVEASTDKDAITALEARIANAIEKRRLQDRVQRFTVGPLIAEYISDWLPDDRSAPQLGPVRRLGR